MKPDYTNKNVAVLGAGRSGKAAALLLAEEGAKVTMLDSAPEEKLAGLEPLRAKGVYLLCGPAAEEDPALYDLGVFSPGIDPELPLGRNFSRKNIPYYRRAGAWLAILSRPGHRHHRDKRQDDDDGIDLANVECLRPAHRRLREHRQTARRSGVRERRLRRADGGGQFVSTRNDPRFPSRDQRLAQLRARPS